MSEQAAKAQLEAYGLADRIITFDTSTATVELAAIALKCDPDNIAKTLSFIAGERVILVVAAGRTRIDNKKFKTTFHKKPKMIHAEDLQRLTGHQMGGVCPFGIPDNVEVWLDNSLKLHDIVYPACGTAYSGVRLTPEELELASHCRGWVDVTQTNTST